MVVPVVILEDGVRVQAALHVSPHHRLLSRKSNKISAISIDIF